MIRRVMLLILTAVVLVTLSGCMGGGPGIDTAAIRAEIGQVIERFKADVEAYDIDEIDGMLSHLSGSGFKLTLEELGTSYTKTYADLKGELEDEEDRQLYWRANYGYVLELLLDARTFGPNLSATGAIAYQEFSVRERATGIGPIITDVGIITWHFAKISGAWKATEMWIDFSPGAKAAGIRSGGGASKGFGFGVGFENL